VITTILSPRAGGAKPTGGAPLVAHSPLRQGLAYAALFPEIGGAACANAVDQVRGTFGGSTKPSWSGSFLSFPGGANTVAYLDYGTAMPQTQDLALSAFSVAGRIYYKGGDGGICERNDGNTVDQGWEVNISSANNRFGMVYVRSSVDLVQYVAAPTQNKWVTFAITVLAGPAIGGIYFDGVKQTSVVSQAGTGTQSSDASRTFYVGRSTFTNQSAGNGSFNGLIDCLYCWRRLLRHEEILQLQIDPYAPFRRRAPVGGGVVTALAPSTYAGTLAYWHQGLPFDSQGTDPTALRFWLQGLPVVRRTVAGAASGPSVDTFAAILMSTGAIERTRPATRVVSY